MQRIDFTLLFCRVLSHSPGPLPEHRNRPQGSDLGVFRSLSSHSHYLPSPSHGSRNFRIAGAGMAPACRATSNPPLIKTMVGIAVIRNFLAKAGDSSVLTLATPHRPTPSAAILRISGATILQGPHQGAQK